MKFVNEQNDDIIINNKNEIIDNSQNNYIYDEQEINEQMKKQMELFKKRNNSFTYWELKIKYWWKSFREKSFTFKLLVFFIIITLITNTWFLITARNKEKEFVKYVSSYNYYIGNIRNRTRGKLIDIPDEFNVYLITNRLDGNENSPESNKYNMYFVEKQVRLLDNEYLAIFHKGDNLIEFNAGRGYINQRYPEATPEYINENKDVYLKLMYEYNYFDSPQKISFEKKFDTNWIKTLVTGNVITPEKAKNLIIYKTFENGFYDINDIITKTGNSHRQIRRELKETYGDDNYGFWLEYFQKEYPKWLMHHFTKWTLLKADMYVNQNIIDNPSVTMKYFATPYMSEFSYENDNYKTKIELINKIKEENKVKLNKFINQINH